MSRSIMRYRSPRARRLVQKAKIVLVVSCSVAVFTAAALFGSNWKITSFHWVAMAVTAFLAALSLLLEWLAARHGRDPKTGEPDKVDIRPRPVERWQPQPQKLRLPTLPKPPVMVPEPAPAPVKTIPPAPAEPAYASPTPVPVFSDTELAAQS